MNKTLFNKVILPAYYTYKQQNRFKYYQELKKRDELSTKELKDLQWNKLRKLIEHCYKNIPYYRNIFDSLNITPNDIRSLKDYKHLPLLQKHNIKNDYKNLINSKLNDEELIFSCTGGTTGEPLKIYKSFEDNEYGFGLRYRSNNWNEWDLSCKSAWLVADLRRINEFSNSKSLKTKLGLWTKRKLIFDTSKINEESMAIWVKQLKKYKPEFLYGYTSLIHSFAIYILDNDIKINSLKGVYVTAEPILDKELLSQAYNAPIYDQYGSSEIPSIAQECKCGKMHINSDEVYIEFEPIEGEANLCKIICTPLYIYGMPLLRYDIGDLACCKTTTCNCGLNYPVMELKVGRVSQNLKSPSGTLLATANLGWHIAQTTDNVLQYQIIQKSLNEFEINLVCKKTYDIETEKKLFEFLDFLLKSNEIKLNFNYVKEIERLPNGKIQNVVCNV